MNKQRRHWKTSLAGLVAAFGGFLQIICHALLRHPKIANLIFHTGDIYHLVTETGFYLLVGGVVAIGLLAADGKIDN